jgi:hypothetical protein
MAKQKTPLATQQQTTPIGDAYAAFIVARQALNVTLRTVGYYADKLRPFVTHCEHSSITTIDQVTAGTVRAYLVSLQRRGLAPPTVHGAAKGYTGVSALLCGRWAARCRTCVPDAKATKESATGV